MARISGVNLPNKPVAIALTYIFGIGRTSAAKICEASIPCRSAIRSRSRDTDRSG